jgi:hypothetical protein
MHRQGKYPYRPGVLVLLLVGLLILACWLSVTAFNAYEATALHPVAARLDVEPNKAVILEYVADLLKQHQGESRTQIHRLVKELDKDITIGDKRKYIGTQTSETMRWTLGELPLGGKILGEWTLIYDSEDQFIDVGINETGFP